MRLEYLLALGCLFFAAAALLDLIWRHDWPKDWFERIETPPAPPPMPDPYMRDVNPPSWSQPAAKGFTPNVRRATDHRETVVPFIHKRNSRTH